LKGLTSLRILDLGGTQVTDAGLEHLEGLTNLEVLGLAGTRVTDAGLERLKGMTSLRRLELHRVKNAPYMQVTDEGVKKLQEALPDCKIGH